MKITDKIVTVLLSALTLPVALFTPLVHALYKITAWELLEQIVGGGSSAANDTGLTEDAVSVKWMIEKLIDSNASLKGIDTSKFSDGLKAIYPFLLASGILFALAVLTGLVLLIVSIFTRAKKSQCIIAALGATELIACGILFSKFASPIVDGSLSVGSILQSVFGESFSTLGSILTSSMLDVQRLNLTTAWSITMLLFFMIIIWNVSYMVTSDKKADIK